MNLKTIELFAKSSASFISRNSPTILTGLGIGGFVTTVVMAIKATPKAIDILNDEETYRKDGLSQEAIDNLRPLSNEEVVKLTWKVYVPTALMGTASIAAVIAGHSISLRQNAALMGLYTLSETAFKEYQEKVVEQIGERKEQKVRDDISQDRLHKSPVEGAVIFPTNGDVLCFDSLSSRYFMGNIENIRKIQNDLNQSILGGQGYLTLNEFYDELGLEHTKLGEDIGWTLEKIMDLHFTAKVATNGQPCIVLEYRVAPRKV